MRRSFQVTTYDSTVVAWLWSRHRWNFGAHRLLTRILRSRSLSRQRKGRCPPGPIKRYLRYQCTPQIIRLQKRGVGRSDLALNCVQLRQEVIHALLHSKKTGGHTMLPFGRRCRPMRKTRAPSLFVGPRLQHERPLYTTCRWQQPFRVAHALVFKRKRFLCPSSSCQRIP